MHTRFYSILVLLFFLKLFGDMEIQRSITAVIVFAYRIARGLK